MIRQELLFHEGELRVHLQEIDSRMFSENRISE